jgi:hypothetical protein
MCVYGNIKDSCYFEVMFHFIHHVFLIISVAEDAQSAGVDILTEEDSHTGINYLHRQVQYQNVNFSKLY